MIPSKLSPNSFTDTDWRLVTCEFIYRFYNRCRANNIILWLATNRTVLAVPYLWGRLGHGPPLAYLVFVSEFFRCTPTWWTNGWLGLAHLGSPPLGSPPLGLPPLGFPPLGSPSSRVSPSWVSLFWVSPLRGPRNTTEFWVVNCSYFTPCCFAAAPPVFILLNQMANVTCGREEAFLLYVPNDVSDSESMDTHWLPLEAQLPCRALCGGGLCTTDVFCHMSLNYKTLFTCSEPRRTILIYS